MYGKVDKIKVVTGIDNDKGMFLVKGKCYLLDLIYTNRGMDISSSLKKAGYTYC